MTVESSLSSPETANKPHYNTDTLPYHFLESPTRRSTRATTSPGALPPSPPSGPSLSLSTSSPYLLPYRYIRWGVFDNSLLSCPFIYRINDGVSNNNILQVVCHERGWQAYREPTSLLLTQRERDIYSSTNWNLWWSYNFYQGSPFRTLRSWQYTNHHPKGFQFCSKSYLSSFARRMISEYGDVYDFCPKSFIMPEDYIRFLTEHSRRREQVCPDANNVISAVGVPESTESPRVPSSKSSRHGKREVSTKNPVWIVKPVGRSQGKGIYLTTDIGNITHSARSVIQEYISRPLLIGGHKWDLRIYVCVAATDPLTIYLYREGLCRFATGKYDLSNLSSSYSHLTNASLNKLGPDYTTDKEIIGHGCKWTLGQLRSYFRSFNIPDWYMWQKIMAMVILTVVGEGLRSGAVFPAHKNCFDFFGFDILVDEEMRPWLLEANYSPGLSGDCDVDELVKKPMLHDLFDLLGFPDAKNSQEIKKVFGQQQNKLEKVSTDMLKTVQRRKSNLLVDFSSKSRLSNASSIYSQDLVMNYLQRNANNPNFRLSKAMQVLFSRKKVMLRRMKKETRTQAQRRLLEKLASEMGCEEDLDSVLSEIEKSEKSSPEEGGDKRPETSPPNPNQDDNEGLKSDFKKTDFPYLHIKKRDWQIEAPRTSGNWVLIYPCKALPYRSPYRSALSDLRSIVRNIEGYLKVARLLYETDANQSDEAYSSKIKALCQWEIEVWTPPVTPNATNGHVSDEDVSMTGSGETDPNGKELP